MTPTDKLLPLYRDNNRPIYWEEQCSKIHACSGSRVHPCVVLLWTLCEKDVPTDKAFSVSQTQHIDHELSKITCPDCLKKLKPEATRAPVGNAPVGEVGEAVAHAESCTTERMEKAIEAVTDWDTAGLVNTGLVTDMAQAYLELIKSSHLQGWQDISTAPRDGTDIVMYGTGYNDKETFIGSWEKNTWTAWYSCCSYAPRAKPTHWMPLPSPPMGGNQ